MKIVVPPSASWRRSSRRLVEHQQLGVAQERKPDAEPLSHPLAVLLHALVGRVRQADRVQDVVDPVDARADIRPPASRASERLEVATAREVGPERRLLDERAYALERSVAGGHAGTKDLDRSPGRVDQAEGHPDRRGLARTVRAEEAVELAALDREIELVDGGQLAVPLAEADRPDRCRHGRASARACSVATSTGPTRSQVVSARSTVIADSSGPP